MSKGSQRRQSKISYGLWGENYDAIFGKKKLTVKKAVKPSNKEKFKKKAW